MNRRSGVILSYLLMAVEILSTFLLTPFIIRSLGQAEYGVYKLSASIVAYLLLLDLGVGNAVTRYIAKFRVNGETEQARKFLGVTTLYYGAIAILAVIGGIILIAVFPSAFSKGLTADEIVLGQKLLAITTVNTAVTLGTAAYNNVVIAYERFAVSKGVSIIQVILRMALTFVLLKCGMGSIGVVSANLLFTVLCRAFFVLYVLFRLNLRPRFKGADAGFIREIVIYSSMILLQMVATQINATVDQILIGSLVASSATILAIYGVGVQVTQYFQTIGSSVNGVLMPGVVRLVEGGADANALSDEMIRIGRIILMMLAPILGGFLACGKQFILLWAGKENLDAYIVASILLTAYTFILTESIGTQILWAKNQHKEQAILKIVIVILNIFLTILLIKWNPLIGATIGTFISLILGDVVVMNLIFSKKLKVDLLNYYKGLLKGIIPCTVISTLIALILRKFLIQGWLGLIINLLIFVSVYLAALWLFGMNSYEKQLVLNALKHRRKT